MRHLLLLAVAALVALGAALALDRAPAAHALPVLAGPSPESRIDSELSRVLTTLGGRRGEVACWSEEDWRRRTAEFSVHAGTPGAARRGLAGYLSLDRERINLPAKICNRLGALGASVADAYAAKVFAHELQHFRGVREEAVTECFGLQWVAQVATALGADGARARQLAVTAWVELYARESPFYRSPDCVDGGPLDLDPGSAYWP